MDPTVSLPVLVKYTYYGDANLDGKVDGSDYSRIDNAALNHLTGWSNGDFNYDGVIDGSDYTLIDNAFNRQGAALGSSTPAAEIVKSHTFSNTAISSLPTDNSDQKKKRSAQEFLSESSERITLTAV
jgi:hypothetical protein